MFPIDIPKGTTVETLFTRVFPETHARFVTEPPGKEELFAVAEVVGGPTYTVSIRGREVKVEEGEKRGVTLWVSVGLESVELFLEDWMTTKRFVPTYVPAGGMILMTDPRVLRRVAMVSGRLELALTDFEVDGERKRVSMTVGAGDAAKKGIDTESPDAVIEAKTETMTKLLGGKLAPEDALSGGHVALKGKTFVAMQFALAIAPFYPKTK